MSIKASHNRISEIFNGRDTYLIPRFQREFVWTNKEVDAFLEDIHDAHGRDGGEGYFIGVLIVAPAGDCPRSNAYELIDGQQRLTTTLLMLCALRRFMRERGMLEEAGELAQCVFDTSRDLRIQPQYEDERALLLAVAKEEDCSALGAERTSGRKMLHAYRRIMTFLSDRFANDLAETRAFANYLRYDVRAVRIMTSTVTEALRVRQVITPEGSNRTDYSRGGLGPR
jgi:hypothetical protein